MANKNLVIFLVVITVIVVVLVAIVAVKNNDPIQNEQTVSVEKNQSPVNNAVKQSADSQLPADSDTDSIEADLNSVNDDSFGENTLSDAEVGL